MKIALRFLGIELLAIETSDDEQDGPGDCTTSPVGFCPSPGDQRWERGTDLL